MNSQEHKQAAELLLKGIPHDVGILTDTEDLGASQVIILLAQVHATLALVPDPEFVPDVDSPIRYRLT